MTIILAAVLVAAFLFSFVVLFGAPYLPTMRTQQETALDLLNLKKGQIFYDLGSGDGRVLRAAAKRGLKVTGYELNPILCVVSWFYTLRWRRNVKIKCGSFWRANIKDADGIFTFLISGKMVKLDRMIQKQCVKPVKLASHAFHITGKEEAAKKDGVFLYTYSPIARER